MWPFGPLKFPKKEDGGHEDIPLHQDSYYEAPPGETASIDPVIPY